PKEAESPTVVRILPCHPLGSHASPERLSTCKERHLRELLPREAHSRRDDLFRHWRRVRTTLALFGERKVVPDCRYTMPDQRFREGAHERMIHACPRSVREGKNRTRRSRSKHNSRHSAHAG